MRYQGEAMERAVARTRNGRPPGISGLRGQKLIAFGWYGGKFSHLDWLLPLLPTACHHYCEPFAGSPAAVLLNRRPAAVETYNDMDGEVVNFFQVLRDKGDANWSKRSASPLSAVKSLRLPASLMKRFRTWNARGAFMSAPDRSERALLKPHPWAGGRIVRIRAARG